MINVKTRSLLKVGVLQCTTCSYSCQLTCYFVEFLLFFKYNLYILLYVTPRVFRSNYRKYLGTSREFFVYYQLSNQHAHIKLFLIFDSRCQLYNTVQYTDKVIVHYTMQITNNNMNYRFVPP